MVCKVKLKNVQSPIFSKLKVKSGNLHVLKFAKVTQLKSESEVKNCKNFYLYSFILNHLHKSTNRNHIFSFIYVFIYDYFIKIISHFSFNSHNTLKMKPPIIGMSTTELDRKKIDRTESIWFGSVRSLVENLQSN